MSFSFSSGDDASPPNSLECAAFDQHAPSIGQLTRRLVRGEKSTLLPYLKSIALDARFVATAAADLGSRAPCPLFANLRNGLWYAPAFDGTGYFKSTDGHVGGWDFSMTRLNLHVASAAATAGCIALVDSTRRGKQYPDALTKTVPIWCAVVNTAVRWRRRREAVAGGLGGVGGGAAGACDGDADGSTYGLNGDVNGAGIDDALEGMEGLGGEDEGEAGCWRDTSLHVHPSIPGSEAEQIRGRIEAWAHRLDDLPMISDLARTLRKPLRCAWLSPGDEIGVSGFGESGEGWQGKGGQGEGSGVGSGQSDGGEGGYTQEYTPVYCISASRVISREAHREHHSWRYIQGAGDDEENWAAGMTPKLFWQHADDLLTIDDPDEFHAAALAIVAKGKHGGRGGDRKRQGEGTEGNGSGEAEAGGGAALARDEVAALAAASLHTIADTGVIVGSGECLEHVGALRSGGFLPRLQLTIDLRSAGNGGNSGNSGNDGEGGGRKGGEGGDSCKPSCGNDDNGDNGDDGGSGGGGDSGGVLCASLSSGAVPEVKCGGRDVDNSTALPDSRSSPTACEHFVYPLHSGKGKNAKNVWQDHVLPQVLIRGASALAAGGMCLVVCDSGNDLSVVAALALLVAFCDKNSGARLDIARIGTASVSSDDDSVHAAVSAAGRTKDDIRRAFMILQQFHSFAAPPRRLMKELNAFFVPSLSGNWHSVVVPRLAAAVRSDRF